MQAPLAGLRVVEFTHMVMGPACGMALADLGADVVKVEPADKGDQTRWLKGAGAGFFAMFNRNKRSFAVDLKSEQGIAQVRALLRSADVLLENFRPGAMDRLGLSWDALRAENGRLIYCSCKGFLPGPYEHRVALDEVVQMMGGLAYMTGLPGRPMRAGSSVNDILGGTLAALGVVAALEERRRTGRGKHVQSGLFETNALLVAQHMAQAFISGEPPPPMGVRRPAWPIYDIFECGEGEQVFVGVVTDTQWQLFGREFGLDELLADPALQTQEQRRAGRERVIPRVAEAMRGYSKPELMAKLEALGIPFAPIATPWDLFDDPHLGESGGLLPITTLDGRTVALPGFPLALDGERLALHHDLPRLGEHTAEILREIGWSADDRSCNAGSVPA